MLDVHRNAGLNVEADEEDKKVTPYPPTLLRLTISAYPKLLIIAVTHIQESKF